MPAIPPDSNAIADTQAWLESAVIGLNLCPFAKAVHVRGQVHYAVCDSAEPGDLLEALEFEAKSLQAQDPSRRDTTLLIATGCLEDFLDFNDFLGRAERLLARRGFDGVLQLASFHPQYQFAGTEADDVGNCSNRAPWPTLHLLREASIDRAVEAFPDAEAIFGHNIDTLEQLGFAGWQALDVGPGAGARHAAGEGA
ncbi:DUF1415 domain-containing protein [Xylophilus sp. GW821-FHT01B05]